MLIILSLFVATWAYAGAWGDGSFENDDALDWVAECTRSRDIIPVRRALESVLNVSYIEAPQASEAIAASEVVAASLGKPSPKLPPELKTWLRHQRLAQISQLAPLAKKALARIRDPKISELWQLWSEGKLNKWPSVISELEKRLEK
jgi:hypothetical protein